MRSSARRERGHDHAGEVARLLPPQHVVVDDGQRVAGLGDVHPRQRAPGAADQVEVAPLAASRQPGHPARELLLGDGARAHQVAAGAVRQADGAERQGGGAAAPPAVQPHQFQRAAAEVAQDAVGAGEAQQHARRRRARASSSPARTWIGTPGMRACSAATKSGPLVASRTAAVASTSSGSAPMARATAW